jgi:hypothetical protein
MTKKQNKRIAKKRGIQQNSDTTKDTMRSARRNYGKGSSK